ncbi:HlyD family efflux transporter periplasmic adaptor subunit [Aurantivibrio infirmus]
MNQKNKRWITYIGVAILGVVVAALILQPKSIAVDIATIDRGILTVTIEEEGQTRARDRYTIAAPITGRLLRTEYKEGQTVQQGDVLTGIAPTPDDARTEAALRANVRAAQARLNEVRAILEEAEGNQKRAQAEFERRNDLYEKNIVSVESRDFYEQEALSSKARVASVKASVEAAEAALESASSQLIGINQSTVQSSYVVPVVSPASGKVIRVFQESERVVAAGSALFELSSGADLELVIDLLTQDAVQVKAGDPIIITGWGGDSILKGEVVYVEPGAFTKISTLGVEEQRVNVIGHLIENTSLLGTGYRIEAAIVVWEADDILRIPTSAIFRRHNAWQTFVVENNQAQLRKIDIGKRSIDFAQVLDGLVEGEEVVVFPSDLIEDGVRVSVD